MESWNVNVSFDKSPERPEWPPSGSTVQVAIGDCILRDCRAGDKRFCTVVGSSQPDMNSALDMVVV